MARPWRLYRQVYGAGLLALILVGAGLFAVAFGRLAFDYARSYEKPSLAELKGLPLFTRTAQYLEATAVNAATRLPAAAKEPIVTIDITADPEQLSLLGPREAKTTGREVSGQLRMGKRWVPVKLNLRGDNIFQWGGELRSFKVTLGKDEAILGQRELNLINPKDPAAFSLPYGEYVAQRFGLLVPGTQPCRFLLNGENQGVYFCQQPIDEAWLRQQRRIPGNIYVGDYLIYGYGSNLSDAVHLWDVPGFWKQTAWVMDQGETRGELTELFGAFREIVHAPATADPAPLRERLARIAHVDAFLQQWAVHAWTDSPHQDEYHNWRLYFDPSRGAFEPVVWDTLRSWSPQGAAALDAPLPRPHLAMLRFPELNQRRYEILYRKLIEPELAERPSERWAAAYMRNTRGTLLSAVSVDRMNWTPGVLMWLPVTRFQALTEQRHEVAIVAEHTRALAEELAAIRVVEPVCAREGTGLACRLGLASRAGLRLVGAVGRDRASWPLVLGSVRGGAPEFKPGLAAPAIAFYPQFVTVPNPPFPGRYKAVLTAAPQPFYLALPPVRALVFENALTGARAEVPVPTVDALPPAPAVPVYTLRPAYAERLAPVHLGPGRVDVRESIVTAVGQGLAIAPGTTLRMAPGVSLIARGPLRMEGTRERPIAVMQREPGQRWGGILVIGEATAGSRLRHCRIAGGTVAGFAKVSVKGMVEIAHSSDLTIADCAIGDNGVGDDTLHVLQVTGVRFERLRVHDGRSDCIDLDYVDAVITDLRSERCVNDGLDMMTSAAAVTGAVLTHCGDKGASIGERSVAWFTGAHFTGDTLGIQVKDLSEAYLESSNVFAGNRTDISAYRKSKYYGDGGCIVSAIAAPLSTSLLDGSRLVRASSLTDYRERWRTSGRAGPCWSSP